MSSSISAGPASPEQLVEREGALRLFASQAKALDTISAISFPLRFAVAPFYANFSAQPQPKQEPCRSPKPATGRTSPPRKMRRTFRSVDMEFSLLGTRPHQY